MKYAQQVQALGQAMAVIVVGLCWPRAAGAQASCQLSEQVELQAASTTGGDRYGFAVDVFGDVAVVGAYRHDPGGLVNAGAVYVYRFDGAVWIPDLIHGGAAMLTAPDAAAGDEFGYDVAVGQQRMVIGAPQAGAVYLYERDAAGWGYSATLQPAVGSASDHFGGAVGLHGDTVVVGARSADVAGINSGAAYVFQRIAGDWQQQATLVADESSVTLDYFGTAVGIDQDVIVVGADYDDANGENAGAAYVFRRASGPCAGSTCPWLQEAKLGGFGDPPGSYVSDFFGFSTAVSGTVVAVGARRHSHSGLNLAGATYVFRWNSGSWVPEAVLTAMDAEHFDQFGYAVDVQGPVIAVGAKGADTGVEPDSGEPWAAAGAAYVFRYEGGQWNEHAKLVDSDPFLDDWLGGAVAVSGQHVIAGAEGTDLFDGPGGWFSGSAFVFASGCQGGTCLADIDNDGAAGGFDLALLLAAWGWNPGHPADFNQDGMVNDPDLAALLGGWGPCE